uniref:Uncharacterized protein n=1 Tax=Mycena chlorophos TaxID=658473 RepID=A0ABQ0LIY1_MYCCL|nr:predicted protein [Mycena chlorophos]
MDVPPSTPQRSPVATIANSSASASSLQDLSTRSGPPTPLSANMHAAFQNTATEASKRLFANIQRDLNQLEGLKVLNKKTLNGIIMRELKLTENSEKYLSSLMIIAGIRSSLPGAPVNTYAPPKLALFWGVFMATQIICPSLKDGEIFYLPRTIYGFDAKLPSILSPDELESIAEFFSQKLDRDSASQIFERRRTQYNWIVGGEFFGLDAGTDWPGRLFSRSVISSAFKDQRAAATAPLLFAEHSTLIRLFHSQRLAFLDIKSAKSRTLKAGNLLLKAEASFQAARETLEAQLAQAHRDLQAAVESRQALETNLGLLRAELTTSHTNTEQESRHRKELTSIELARDQLETALVNMRSSRDHANEEVGRLGPEVETLKAALQKSKKYSDELYASSQVLQNNLAQESLRQRREIESADADRLRREEQEAELKAQLEEGRRKEVDLESKVQHLDAQLVSKEVYISQVESNFEQTQAALNQAEAKYIALKKIHDDTVLRLKAEQEKPEACPSLVKDQTYSKAAERLPTASWLSWEAAPHAPSMGTCKAVVLGGPDQA